ncbi:hypothetical protein DFH07DRAFT_826348 [Mycena maculata]|uniref:DUF6533 domain-containing protein n=1 Tax=Mycena maculata TaxID=230809 RepID=A0AAD7IW02_9AGAR|nr:hypothetical protein DFH07DRAFT_826348 [Mycena maculata]
MADHALSLIIDHEASIMATRYFSAVAVALVFCDHCLTSGDEIQFIWMNTKAGSGNRAGFLINRYVTEAMVAYVTYMLSGMAGGQTDRVCQIFIWLFAIASTVFVAVSHFLIISRLYTLWDRRKIIKWILLGSFGVTISIAMAFCILAAHQVQPFLVYNPLLHMCTFTQKPWALPYMLGALTLFDGFIILMTIVNALDRPHHTQADVVTALVRDGALMFVGLFVLRFINLMMAIFGNPSNCFVTLSTVWAVCCIVNSRIQLRVENLRFVRYTRQPGESSEDVEIHQLAMLS